MPTIKHGYTTKAMPMPNGMSMAQVKLINKMMTQQSVGTKVFTEKQKETPTRLPRR